MSPNNAFVDGGAAGAAAAPKMSAPPPESKEILRRFLSALGGLQKLR